MARLYMPECYRDLERPAWRDHNGERGGVPICAGGRLHDWRVIRLIRVLVVDWQERRR